MQVKEDISEEIKSNQPILLKFAPAWKRILSYVIDLLILGLIVYIMLFSIFYKALLEISKQTDFTTQFNLIRDFMDSHNTQISIANFIIQAAYFSLSWRGSGQTIGARIFKIVVMSMDKKRLSFIQGIARYSLLSLSSLAFYIPLLFTINPVYHQRIHDILTGSVVVEMPEEKESKDDKKEEELAAEDQSE